MSNITFFIDESGNTGDLVNAKESLDFGGQPYFGLGCIGLKDLDRFEDDINQLKVKHNIKSEDMKSTKIYNKKPGFILDVIRHIKDNEIPFFIELVEKRFFISTYISFYLVYPPYYNSKDDEANNYIRNVFAQIISLQAPDEVFIQYMRACYNQSEKSLMEAFKALREFSESKPNDYLFRELKRCIDMTLDDYSTMLEDEGDEVKAVKRFLPMPDTGKKGKEYFILPNYSSWTNIYARVNRCYFGSIKNISFVHDEQAQFDYILHDAKVNAESYSGKDFVTPNSDYNFKEQSVLSFSSSKDCLGIQVSDIIIGFFVKYAQDIMVHEKNVNSILKEAFFTMVGAENEEKGYGVNYVWAYNELIAPSGALN